MHQSKYWKDLEVGGTFETETISSVATNIIKYAADFDPQPDHLDPVIAETSIFGGHCASGWQVRADDTLKAAVAIVDRQ